MLNRRELIKKAFQTAVIAPIAISTIEASTPKTSPQEIEYFNPHNNTLLKVEHKSANDPLGQRIQVIIDENSPTMETARQMGVRSHNTKTGIFTDVLTKS